MTASAAVLAFPTATPSIPCFDPSDRNVIVGAAMSMSPSWAASFFLDDEGAEVASIGPFSAGQDEEDRWGFAILGRGRIELVDFQDPETFSVHRTVGEAVEAMRAAMARQDV